MSLFDPYVLFFFKIRFHFLLRNHECYINDLLYKEKGKNMECCLNNTCNTMIMFPRGSVKCSRVHKCTCAFCISMIKSAII